MNNNEPTDPFGRDAAVRAGARAVESASGQLTTGFENESRAVVEPGDGATVVEDRPAVLGVAPSESIRVDVQLLDDLMNLVGELVLARNQILQFTQERSDPALTATSQRLNLITT